MPISLNNINGITANPENLIYQKDCNFQMVGSLFFIGLFDASKYDIIQTENKNSIDRFLPEILTFKVCPTRVGHVLDTCWTLFKHQYHWNTTSFCYLAHIKCVVEK